MRLLLDTHVFLWAIAASPLLKPVARKSIASAQCVYVSSASIWEVAIKARLGKLDASADEVLAAIEASGFVELPVSGAHSACVAGLPLHHHDPFDRILVAQSICEPLRLLTGDGAMLAYGETILPM